MAARMDGVPLSMRISSAMLAELDALIVRINPDPDMMLLLAPGRQISRSAMLRLAVATGIEVLNRKYPGPPSKAKTKRKAKRKAK